jgi:hypothetical protein
MCMISFKNKNAYTLHRLYSFVLYDSHNKHFEHFLKQR